MGHETKKLVSFRLPADVIRLLLIKSQAQRISRNKLLEFILLDYCARNSSELRALITNPPPRETSSDQIDLFA